MPLFLGSRNIGGCSGHPTFHGSLVSRFAIAAAQSGNFGLLALDELHAEIIPILVPGIVTALTPGRGGVLWLTHFKRVPVAGVVLLDTTLEVRIDVFFLALHCLLCLDVTFSTGFDHLLDIFHRRRRVLAHSGLIHRFHLRGCCWLVYLKTKRLLKIKRIGITRCILLSMCPALISGWT